MNILRNILKYNSSFSYDKNFIDAIHCVNLIIIYDKSLTICHNSWLFEYSINLIKPSSKVGTKILHSVYNLPSIILEKSYLNETAIDGGKLWYKYNKLHRDNKLLPSAIIENTYSNSNNFLDKFESSEIYNYFTQNKIWSKYGKFHRDNGLPAIIINNSDYFWYVNGKLHRNDDLPAIINMNNCFFWYQNGKLSRNNNYPYAIISTLNDFLMSCYLNKNIIPKEGNPFRNNSVKSNSFESHIIADHIIANDNYQYFNNDKMNYFPNKVNNEWFSNHDNIMYIEKDTTLISIILKLMDICN